MKHLTSRRFTGFWMIDLPQMDLLLLRLGLAFPSCQDSVTKIGPVCNLASFDRSKLMRPKMIFM